VAVDLVGHGRIDDVVVHDPFLRGLD